MWVLLGFWRRCRGRSGFVRRRYSRLYQLERRVCARIRGLCQLHAYFDRPERYGLEPVRQPRLQWWLPIQRAPILVDDWWNYELGRLHVHFWFNENQPTVRLRRLESHSQPDLELWYAHLR